MGLRANLNTETTINRTKLKPTGKLSINGTIVNHSVPQNYSKRIEKTKTTRTIKEPAQNNASVEKQQQQQKYGIGNENDGKTNNVHKIITYECVDQIEEEEYEEEEEIDDDDDKHEEGEVVVDTTTTMTTTTYRSNSASALLANSMRPQTLNVQQLQRSPSNQTHYFFGDVVTAWRAKARCNVVPAERTEELFHELNLHPNEKQISEMLQTAKTLACKSSQQANGLTFGEFCVLAADLKRFRASALSSTSIYDKVNLLNALDHDNTNTNTNTNTNSNKNSNIVVGSELRSTKSLSHVEDCTKKKKTSITDQTPPVEVFLGGSCNPTTWRADVAIPVLNELGISFYNPQVSEWTPDLIELEHRAKEKARVLFFVMDSETRASAGAIEVAHIAGQNCKQLVLVLHPYKPNQTILKERISQQEYMELIHNQMIMRELVARRGYQVLDNIPSALQRTKELLAGVRQPPSNIASILVVVRGAFDRVNPLNDNINLQQCQRALSYLGYDQNLLSLDNLNKIISKQEIPADENISVLKVKLEQPEKAHINFDLFCVISAYLSVWQQEIQESGCISPIKGTNLPPPPVYLTNMQGNESFSLCFYGKNISRTSSNTSVPSSSNEPGSSDELRQSVGDMLSRSRDSGTSSPQPHEQPRRIQKQKSQQQILVNYETIETKTEITTTKTLTKPASKHATEPACSASNSLEEESDSNDSVFSSSSSINSVANGGSADDLLNCITSTSSMECRDVYLGGSCARGSKWRQECAVPYLKTKGVTYHLPSLHESLTPEQMQSLQSGVPETVGTQSCSYMRTRRKKTGGDELSLAKEESHISWTLPPMRQTIYNPALLDSSRVLLFVITNETRSLAPMTLAAHCIGLMYNMVLCVQTMPEECVIGGEKLTPLAIKDYNRGRSYLIDLAKRQGVPVYSDLKAALECTVKKVQSTHCRKQQCD